MNKKKVRILIKKFFSAEEQMNFINIKDRILLIYILNILSIIITDAFSNIIQKLLNNKLSESDNLLNKILKNLKKLLTENLAAIINYQFQNRILLLYIRKFIIIILYKNNKKNYSLSDSYYLITLENLLTKLIKKILTAVIIEAIKKYNLLL